MRLILTGAKVYTPEKCHQQGTVIIEGGKIKDVVRGEPEHCEGLVIEFDREDIVTPGLIDVHTHGYKGRAVAPDQAELSGLSFVLASEGVTGFLGTAMTAPLEELAAILAAGEECRKRVLPGAALLGIHLEGPFLNPDYAGFQERRFLRPPALSDLYFLLEKGGPIALLTLAPELPNALEVVRAASREGTIVSAGHSAATFEETLAAVRAGLSHTTHIFNRMAPLHHREPGLVGAALTLPQISVEAIADCVHLHPAILQLLFMLKKENLVVISDTLPCSGLPPGVYEVGSSKVEVTPDSVRTNEGKLAGGALPLPQALSRFRKLSGLPLEKILPAVTINPARLLRLDHRKGRLAPGYDADISVFSKDFVPLLTIVGGRVVYEKPL
ncbi:MAG: N-acetylglucosamine-6-phosphate deacetylase [Thermoanaerobacterales bacterium 50_218]|nr:MAG: N-acetylglucosamine-6-phosphate deacetylase [Thermoanaerobacterales bacterium 50_218]HAA90512.1 N-acetylglucosamine-6-phosphate deacetylase [Peptococcaceae bacterium]